MQFAALSTALLLLPLTTLASPVAVSEADSISNAPIPDISPRDSNNIFDRASGADCKIINVSSY
ncbi:hypothetical protein VE04_10232, partial [Pseudogymnoascus sp. 24MN13]